MMRALIMSDSHGNDELLKEIIQNAWKRYGKIDYYLFLGDGVRDFQMMESVILLPFPNSLLFSVKGNCDWGVELAPEERVLHIGNTQVFMTHGNRYAVKQDLEMVDAASSRAGCTVTLYGHTHHQMKSCLNTILVNPGSIRDRHAAVIDFLPDGSVVTELITL